MNSTSRPLKILAFYIAITAVVGLILMMTPSAILLNWVEMDWPDKYVKGPLNVLQFGYVVIIMCVAFYNIYFYREYKERLIFASAIIVVGLISLFSITLKLPSRLVEFLGASSWILLIGAGIYYSIIIKKRKLKYAGIDPLLSTQTKELQALGYEGILKLLNTEKTEEKQFEGATFIVETGVEMEEKDKLVVSIFVRVADKPSDGGFGDSFIISPDGSVE